MKKILFSVAILATTSYYGQISLEHSFDPNEKVLVYSDNTTLKYVTLLGTKFSIYNSDYSLYKTFTISLPPKYSSISISTHDNFNFNVSKHLFNTDDKLEFFVFFEGSGGNLIVYNEDGNVVKDFNGSYDYQVIDVFHDSTTNTNKLKMGKYISQYSFDVAYDIFSLPTSSLTTREIQSKSKLSAYPVPTNKSLNILNPKNGSNIVKIFDTTGRLILEKKFFSSDSQISIDVENLPKGNYIYKVGDQTSKFIKN